jgi:hypothetical protein
MLSRLGLEEVHARLTQRHGDFDVVFLENQLLGPRKKIVDHPQFTERFVGIFNFALHITPSRYVKSSVRRAHDQLLSHQPIGHPESRRANNRKGGWGR